MSAYIPTVIAEDVTGVLWGKLLVNCGINPLTAIMKITNGQLPEIPALCEVMRKAVGEGAAIARASGITLPYSDLAARVIEVRAAPLATVLQCCRTLKRGRRRR